MCSLSYWLKERCRRRILLWLEPCWFLGMLAINPLSLEGNSQSSPLLLTQTSDMMMINCLDMTAPSTRLMNYVVQGMTKDSPLSACNINYWQYFINSLLPILVTALHIKFSVFSGRGFQFWIISAFFWIHLARRPFIFLSFLLACRIACSHSCVQ